jgi:hypothetical protein
MADGEEGFAAGVETYVLIANMSNQYGAAKVTLYFDDGSSVEKTVELLPNSRTNVPIRAPRDDVRFTAGLREGSGSGFGNAATNRRFGILVDSLAVGGAPPAQVVVERASYWNGPGTTAWAAGTNALATRLQ